MAITVVRLGTPRRASEGPRIGTVRRPPRGVRKTEYAKRNYYDVWLPELAPSAELVRWALAKPWTKARWVTFARRYRVEMKEPIPRHFLAVLAALSATASFAVGCYCEDETRCHRTLLRQILREQGATVS